MKLDGKPSLQPFPLINDAIPINVASPLITIVIGPPESDEHVPARTSPAPIPEVQTVGRQDKFEDETNIFQNLQLTVCLL